MVALVGTRRRPTSASHRSRKAAGRVAALVLAAALHGARAQTYELVGDSPGWTAPAVVSFTYAELAAAVGAEGAAEACCARLDQGAVVAIEDASCVTCWAVDDVDGGVATLFGGLRLQAGWWVDCSLFSRQLLAHVEALRVDDPNADDDDGRVLVSDVYLPNRCPGGARACPESPSGDAVAGGAGEGPRGFAEWEGCAAGYQGPLCAGCVEGFYKTSGIGARARAAACGLLARGRVPCRSPRTPAPPPHTRVTQASRRLVLARLTHATHAAARLPPPVLAARGRVQAVHRDGHRPERHVCDRLRRGRRLGRVLRHRSHHGPRPAQASRRGDHESATSGPSGVASRGSHACEQSDPPPHAHTPLTLCTAWLMPPSAHAYAHPPHALATRTRRTHPPHVLHVLHLLRVAPRLVRRRWWCARWWTTANGTPCSAPRAAEATTSTAAGPGWAGRWGWSSLYSAALRSPRRSGRASSPRLASRCGLTSGVLCRWPVDGGEGA